MSNPGVSEGVSERIRSRSADLTPTERRIAEVVATRPQTVGFGTVADVASAAGAGAASVVRLAVKLGYEGFSDLQLAVQAELASQLRPAAERIRASGSAPIDRHAQVEVGNVSSTLDAVDPAALDRTVARLADGSVPVLVLSGDASVGVAAQFVGDLGLLRDGVGLLEGNEVAIRRRLAVAGPDPTVVAIDLRRYDRWLVDTVRRAAADGAWVAALTDRVLSPLAEVARSTFVVTAGSVGPVDSHVGTMALLNLVLNETAARLRASATDRLDAIEAAWRDALTD